MTNKTSEKYLEKASRIQRLQRIIQLLDQVSN